MSFTARELVASLTDEQVKRLFYESFDTRNSLLLTCTIDGLAAYCPNAIFELLSKKFKEGLVIKQDSSIASILSSKLNDIRYVHPCFEILAERLKTTEVDVEEFESILWESTGNSSMTT